MGKYQSHAVVEVTIEVRAGQPWGDKSSMTEVFEQAERDAIRRVRRLIEEKALSMRVVGGPRVRVITSRKCDDD